MNDLSENGAGLEERSLKRRWRKDTLREVTVRGTTLFKKYWVRPGTRRYPRPWENECRALEKMKRTPGYPSDFHCTQDVVDGGLRVVFSRDMIPGAVLSGVGTEDLPELAKALAQIHGHGVVLDDASAGNFIRAEDGRFRAVDFGRARVFKRKGVVFHCWIGRELAKFLRETLNKREDYYRIFLASYLPLMNMRRWARWLVAAGFHVTVWTRHWRKESWWAHVQERAGRFFRRRPERE